jgi:hypothetical protein
LLLLLLMRGFVGVLHQLVGGVCFCRSARQMCVEGSSTVTSRLSVIDRA